MYSKQLKGGYTRLVSTDDVDWRQAGIRDTIECNVCKSRLWGVVGWPSAQS